MEDTSVSLAKSDSPSKEPRPSPADLQEFLPWAALQLGFFQPFNVKKNFQSIPITKGKAKSTKELKPDIVIDFKQSSSSHDTAIIQNGINIMLTYQAEDLVHISFEEAKCLPRELIQLINMVLEFYPNLNGITVNCGIDKYTVYELSKGLSIANITEIYMNDTFVVEANYALLLDKPNNLQILSLARCKIGDAGVKEIAGKLHYPLPASKKLVSLNLSSNRLTDRGAVYLAAALRSNRKLSYLNISSNMITDKGGEAILNVFKPFPFTAEEQLDFKHRYVGYLKLKDTMIEECLADLKAGGEKRAGLKNQAKKSMISLKKREEMTVDLIDKAANLVRLNLGEFDDPMNESFIEKERRYSKGNNTLVYLNIAYNTLSLHFLKVLVKVLEYQHTSDMRMKSLMNIRLEGNPLPETCTELVQIENFLAHGFFLLCNKKSSREFTKKVKAKT